MIWDNVADIVAGINQIGVFLLGLPQILLNIVLSTGLIIVYPFLKLIDIFIYDIGIIYSPFAELINQLILIQQIPLMLWTMVFPLPSEWTMIIMFQITIAVFIRIYRWIASIPFIAVIFGGGQ